VVVGGTVVVVVDVVVVVVVVDVVVVVLVVDVDVVASVVLGAGVLAKVVLAHAVSRVKAPAAKDTRPGMRIPVRTYRAGDRDARQMQGFSREIRRIATESVHNGVSGPAGREG